MAFENLKSSGIKYVLEKLKDVFVQIRDAVRSVNGEEPDENGNITITSVPFAQNLESESTHINDGLSSSAWLVVTGQSPTPGRG